MSIKKTKKNAAYAKMLWDKAQLRTATASEQLDKSMAVILQYKEEVSPEALQDALVQVEKQREDIKTYLLNERDKFAAKIEAIGEEHFRGLVATDPWYIELKSKFEAGEATEEVEE